MDLKSVRQLAELLSRTDPRKTRGYLDSTFAGIEQGDVVFKDKETIFEYICLLKRYGFIDHARKLSQRYMPFALEKTEIPFPIQITNVLTLDGEFKGYSTLVLGQKLTASGPGWTLHEPIAHIIAPSNGYRRGQILSRLPENAMDHDLFFFEMKPQSQKK